jgi:hypothetical protein
MNFPWDKKTFSLFLTLHKKFWTDWSVSSTPGSLFAVYVRCPKRGVTGVPVFEFALSSQTFSSISSCLLHYFEKYGLSYSIAPRFPSTVNFHFLLWKCLTKKCTTTHESLDLNKPMLASLLLVFQKSTPIQYMKDVWKLATNAHDAKLPGNVLCVYVCRVDCHRFLKLNIAKKYRRKPSKEVSDTCKLLRLSLFSGSTLLSFYRRTRRYFCLDSNGMLFWNSKKGRSRW